MSKPIKYKAPKRGTVVYDVADPRHHGIVKSLHLHDGKFCASVKWIDGWHSTRVPVANLRRVTADTPSEPDRARPVLKLKRRARQIGFGVYRGFPTRFSTDTGEVWTCFMHSRSRGRKGTWSQPTRSIQVLVYECGVLTGQKYRQLFGDVPPLPPAAFRSGWSSRLGALAHDPAQKTGVHFSRSCPRGTDLARCSAPPHSSPAVPCRSNRNARSISILWSSLVGTKV